MKKQNKYNYLKVIQQNYGQGWEDNSTYSATSTGRAIEQSGVKGTSLLKLDYAEYKLTGYPTRIIFRKELNSL